MEDNSSTEKKDLEELDALNIGKDVIDNHGYHSMLQPSQADYITVLSLQ
jgi:hypothetical protein